MPPRLPPLFDDASLLHVREEPATLAAAVLAATNGPQRLMDFLVMAVGKGPSKTLEGVQVLADELAHAQGRGVMCIPVVTAPTQAAGEHFLREAWDDEQLSQDVTGWARLQFRANASQMDAVLPFAFVLFVNCAAAVMPWWTAVAVVPGAVMLMGVVQFVAGSMPSGRRERPRLSALMVVALLVAGFSVFLTTLAPAMLAERPGLVALEAAAFAVNAWAFWGTVFRDAGLLPRNTLEPGQPLPPGARVCATCNALRPVRSKHDPFMGRCVRKFDHYCPLVWNAVGEGNQAHFVLFCWTMLLGQAVFLRLGAAFLAARGEGLLTVLRTHPGRGWATHPVVALNMGLQAGCLAFNLLLCVRAAYGVAAELTSNEMANTGRYAYLHDPATGAYDNPFDAGVLPNARRFFAQLARGAPPVDWDALAAAARAGQAPPRPWLSMSRAFRIAQRCGQRMGWAARQREMKAGGDAAAHGHSHGGRACGHDHGHGHGGMAPASQLPPAVLAQLMAAQQAAQQQAAAQQAAAQLAATAV